MVDRIMMSHDMHVSMICMYVCDGVWILL